MSVARRCSYWRRLAGAAVVGLAPSVAGAEEVAAAAATPERSVELFVIGTPEQFQQSQTAVTKAEVGVRAIHWQRTAPFVAAALLDSVQAPDDVIRCWIDWSKQHVIDVYFADARTDRFLVRTLPAAFDSPELRREALAQVIELSVMAMTREPEGALSRTAAADLLRPVESERPTGAEMGAPPPRIESSESSLVWEMGIAYAVEPLFDYSSFVHGPALAASVNFGANDLWGIWAQGQYQLEQTWRNTLAGLTLSTTALRLGGELAPSIYGSGADRLELYLTARLGLGGDFVRFSPEPGTDTVNLNSASSVVNFVATVGVAPKLRWGSRLTLRAGAFLDISPGAAHYDVVLDGEQIVVFEPLDFRPGLSFIASIRLD